jgi:lipopolysaccharide export system protein LptA
VEEKTVGLNRWPKTWTFVAGVTMAWTLGGLTTLAGAQSLREGIEAPISIYIVSDRMEADNKNQWVYFIGNVTATRGEMTLHSDRLEIYRNEEKDEIDRIEAIGHVDINHQGRFATGDKAVFHEADQSLVLTGNPKAWENSNIITGDKMIFYLETDQVVVEGNENKRVDVVLYPDGEDNRYIRTSPARRETPSPEEDGVGGVQDNGTSELPAGGPGAGEVLSTP